MEKIAETILALADEKKYKALRDVMSVMRAFDLACILDEIDNEKRAVLFRLLPKELAADVFVELYDDVQEQLIQGFTDSELSAVINELYVDDAADIVEEMPANVVKRILRHASSDMRKMINEVLKYPEDSAGSIMNTEYISLRTTMTVGQAIEHIRKTGVDKETINTLYVTERSRKLIGAVSIRDMLFSEPQSTIHDIMAADGILSVTTLDDKENVARNFEKYSITELPVVDKEHRLVGIVTVDDAIDVLQEEATEDIEKMAAITPTNEPYLKQKVYKIFMNRIPWLVILMLSTTFTGIIISSFESALSVIPVLTAFIPMLMDTGGNCGSQASVTVIRSLSIEELKFCDLFRVVFKELRVSICCGVVLALTSYVKILLIDNLLLGRGITVGVSLVVSATLLVTVVIAKLVGCAMPMIARRLGFDPAVMASPFITTIVDAVSLLVYFSFATSIM